MTERRQFPRELDSKLGRDLSKADIERFAREDPKVYHHLELVRRKELLEQVLKEMEDLRQLEGIDNKRSGRSKAMASDARARGKWSLF